MSLFRPIAIVILIVLIAPSAKTNAEDIQVEQLPSALLNYIAEAQKLKTAQFRYECWDKVENLGKYQLTPEKNKFVEEILKARGMGDLIQKTKPFTIQANVVDGWQFLYSSTARFDLRESPHRYWIEKPLGYGLGAQSSDSVARQTVAFDGEKRSSFSTGVATVNFSSNKGFLDLDCYPLRGIGFDCVASDDGKSILSLPDLILTRRCLPIESDGLTFEVPHVGDSAIASSSDVGRFVRFRLTEIDGRTIPDWILTGFRIDSTSSGEKNVIRATNRDFNVCNDCIFPGKTLVEKLNNDGLTWNVEQEIRFVKDSPEFNKPYTALDFQIQPPKGVGLFDSDKNMIIQLPQLVQPSLATRRLWFRFSAIAIATIVLMSIIIFLRRKRGRSANTAVFLAFTLVQAGCNHSINEAYETDFNVKGNVSKVPDDRDAVVFSEQSAKPVRLPTDTIGAYVHSLEIMNRGKDSVLLSDPLPTCSCMSTKLSRHSLDAGQAATLSVEISRTQLQKKSVLEIILPYKNKLGTEAIGEIRYAVAKICLESFSDWEVSPKEISFRGVAKSMSTGQIFLHSKNDMADSWRFTFEPVLPITVEFDHRINNTFVYNAICTHDLPGIKDGKLRIDGDGTPSCVDVRLQILTTSPITWESQVVKLLGNQVQNVELRVALTLQDVEYRSTKDIEVIGPCGTVRPGQYQVRLKRISDSDNKEKRIAKTIYVSGTYEGTRIEVPVVVLGSFN